MNNEEIHQIRTMSFRKAAAKYRIGYPVWKRILSGENEVYRRARSSRNFHAHTENLLRIVESVKDKPHLNTSERAKNLGIRTETVQKILKREGLSRLNARLSYAGFKIETARPLQTARKRRIVEISGTDYETPNPFASFLLHLWSSLCWSQCSLHQRFQSFYESS